MASRLTLLTEIFLKTETFSKNWGLAATKILKKPNDVKTSTLITYIGKQGRRTYNNFKFSSVKDEIDYDSVIKFKEYSLARKKKINTTELQFSHFSTRRGRHIRQLCKQTKNVESRVWIKGIEKQPHQRHDNNWNKRPPSSGKTPIRNGFNARNGNKGRTNYRDGK